MRRWGKDGAVFDGRGAHVVVPASRSLGIGRGNFTIAVAVHTDQVLADVLGDILSCYSPDTRTGFQLSLLTSAGVTAAQANYRHLHFGVDRGSEPRWVDCGRPGNNLRVYSLCVFAGDLYAGTFETGANEAGGVYRYDGAAGWEPCGSPDAANTVASLCVHDGALYAATSRYRAGGSALPESENQHPGGAIYRYAGGTTWASVGRLEAPLVLRRAPRRRAGGDGDDRVQRQALRRHPATLPLGQVYRYDGEETWTLTGQLDTTCAVKYRRVWSMAVYRGRLFAGTLPSGRVYALEAGANVTYDHELEPGWRHLAAVRRATQLELFVDGTRVATSAGTSAADFDLAIDEPLQIGAGPIDTFNGKMRDLRLYGHALDEAEITALC